MYQLFSQLSETHDEATFRELMTSTEYEFRNGCGVTKPVCRIKYSEKQKIVEAMCLHYSVLASLAELEHLRRGLSVQKFNLLMESNPQLIRKAFVIPDTKISSDFLQDLYIPIFSPKGSNRRVIEEA